jgi:2-C-methyl-D-erythritol 4-phosphate cytidylyltransferase
VWRGGDMNIALIFAGGAGIRMNSSTKPKQFLELNGKPIIIHTLEYFESHPDIDHIAVVCIEDWIPYLEKLIKKYHMLKVKWVVPGGETGQQSIYNGLYAIHQDCKSPEETIILIHDGVRPLITSQLVTDNIETVKKYRSAITVTTVTETVITVDPHGKVFEAMDRNICRVAKAPQSFILADIFAAHQKAVSDGNLNMIDSATLMKHYGHSLHTVEGSSENIKITTPADFYIFRAIFEARENSQILGL